MDTWTSFLLWYFLWATRCAKDMGKPCLAYAVDAGSLSRFNQRLVRREASRTDLLIVRSQAAAERLRGWGVAAPLEVTADTAFTFAPDGRTAYLTDATPGAGLLVIDVASHKIRARVPIGTGSAMVLASPDGRRVHVPGQGGSVLTVVDAAAPRVVARVAVGKAPHGLAFTPDGRLLYVASNDGRHVAVVDTSTERVVATIPVPGNADELALER